MKYKMLMMETKLRASDEKYEDRMENMDETIEESAEKLDEKVEESTLGLLNIIKTIGERLDILESNDASSTTMLNVMLQLVLLTTGRQSGNKEMVREAKAELSRLYNRRNEH